MLNFHDTVQTKPGMRNTGRILLIAVMLMGSAACVPTRIQSIDFPANEITSISGSSKAGRIVWVTYRQRNFHPSASAASSLSWGGYRGGSNWKTFGTAVANGNDEWTMNAPGSTINLTQVGPSAAYDGLFTEFRVQSCADLNCAAQNAWKPAIPEESILQRMLIRQEPTQFGVNIAFTEAKMTGVDRVLISAADGNGDADITDPGLAGSTVDDVDMDGFSSPNLSNVFYSQDFGLIPPAAFVNSDFAFLGPSDAEFPFVAGIVSAGRENYHFIASVVDERPPPNGIPIEVSGEVEVDVDLNICFFGLGC